MKNILVSPSWKDFHLDNASEVHLIWKLMHYIFPFYFFLSLHRILQSHNIP